MKVGDRVICIESGFGVSKGSFYKIRHTSNQYGTLYVRLDGLDKTYYGHRFKKVERKEVTTYAIQFPKRFGFASGYLRVTKECNNDYSKDLYKISRKKNDCTLFLSKGAALTWLAAHGINFNNVELLPIQRRMLT